MCVLEVFPVQFMSVSIQSLSLYYRGYGESDKPPKVTDYRMSKLTKDIAELVSIDCNTFDNTSDDIHVYVLVVVANP